MTRDGMLPLPLEGDEMVGVKSVEATWLAEDVQGA